MQVNKDIISFASVLVRDKEKYSDAIGSYEYKGLLFSICDMFYENRNELTYIRVYSNGEVRVRKAIFYFCDISLFFWIVWGFVRIEAGSEAEADKIAFQVVVDRFQNANNKEFNKFYSEFIDTVNACPTQANVERAEEMFERVTDRIMSSLNTGK